MRLSAAIGDASRDGGDVVRIRNTSFPSNTYLYPLAEPSTCVVIDPGLDAALIDEEIIARKVTPRAIMCTHGHFDHVGSASYLQQKYGAPLYLHSADLAIMRSANFLLMAYKVGMRVTIPVPDVVVTGEEFEVSIGDTLFRFLRVPGHTPGSCAIRVGSALFSGDTFYRNGIEELTLPGEDKTLLRHSILGLWRATADDVRVYPGHGASGLLGEIKEKNTALRDFLAVGVLGQ